MNTYLSTNFCIDEFCQSQTAARLGLSNEPPPEVVENLYRTAYAMETVRAILGGKPILVSSAYRSPAVNKSVGGSPTSAHVKGLAVDFTCPTFGTPPEIVAEILKAGVLLFDQLIVEFYDPMKRTGWVHVSFDPRNRKQALVIDKSGTRPFNVGVAA